MLFNTAIFLHPPTYISQNIIVTVGDELEEPGRPPKNPICGELMGMRAASRLG